MQYFSPFNITGLYPDESRLTLSDVQAAKKRMLAEFELQGNPPSIRLGAWELDRHELLVIFEDLTDPEKCRYHLAVYREKSFLYFLEEHALPPDRDWAWMKLLLSNPVFSAEGFTRFISPYFSEAYRNVLGDALLRNDTNTLRILRNLPILCTTDDEHTCFSLARTEITELIALAEECASKTFFDTEAANRICDENRMKSVGMLPDYLSELKENYFVAVADYCIGLFNKQRQRDKAIFVLRQIEKENISNFVRERVQNYLRQMNRIGTSSSSEGSGKGVFSVFGVIAVVVALLRIFLITNKHSSTPNFPVYPNYNNFANTPPQIDVHASDIANSLRAYYLSPGPRSDSLYTNQKEIGSCEKPYSAVLDQQYLLADLLSMQKREKRPTLFLINNTGEQLVLIMEGTSPATAASLFLNEGDSCSNFLLNCETGIQIYIAAGKKWNTVQEVNTSDSASPYLRTGMYGVFDSPDTKNLHLLETPVYVSKIKPAGQTVSRYRLVLSRSKKGKIKTEVTAE